MMSIQKQSLFDMNTASEHYAFFCITHLLQPLGVLTRNFKTFDRFVPDKEFAGTDRSRRREGPVQYEKEEEEDPFNLDNFFKEARKADKRPSEGVSSKGDDNERSSKRRKDK